MIRSTLSLNRRRGAVLIVVLAMLVLFAVVGLSFVLYAESRASAARSNVIAENRETEPDPQAAAQLFTGNLVYDVGDTGDDLMIPIRSHSFARGKLGQQAGLLNLLPFTGTPIPQEPGAFNFNAITDSRQIVRFTWDTTTNSIFDPERFYNGAALRNNPTAALTGTYASKAYNFTYPDRHDYYLAYQNPTTGEIVLPSFHRPDLGSWDPNSGAANYFETKAGGKFLTLRPRKVEHPNFPAVPMNADGTYTGDVQNLKFTTGVQKNDSLWMDAGGPVLRWRGKNYKAMVAPLILDLSGRVNMSIAGNRKGATADPTNPSASNQGWGPWEVNPLAVGVTATELTNILGERYKNATDPPLDRYTQNGYTDRISKNLLMTPEYSRTDANAARSAGSDGPSSLPALAGFNPFPTFTERWSVDSGAQITESSVHPAQFSPLVQTRKSTADPCGFGHDDLLKLYGRFSDPKGRPATSQFAQLSPSAVKSLTTTFSTSQQYASVQIATGAGTFATLGPIDLNRDLLDYRQLPSYPPSASNIFANGSGVTERANRDRQMLARDIYVRLAAMPGFNNTPGPVDGTNVRYNAASGYIEIGAAATAAQRSALTSFAQIAVNIVDYLDIDDVMTKFVWNPDPTNLQGVTAGTPINPEVDPLNYSATAILQRTVFGFELPRLVLNEVYSAVANNPDDPKTGGRATMPLVRQYWLELHNPLPRESNTSTALSDRGAARLAYKQGVTPDVNPATLVAGAYPGPTFNPYRIDIGDVPAANAIRDLTGFVLRARINDFSDVRTPPPVFSLPAQEDERYIVKPIGNIAPSQGPNGGNTGYYILGPKENIPRTGVINTVSLANATPGTVPDGTLNPALAVNALSYDVTPAMYDNNRINDEIAKKSAVILHRLVNPYLPAQEIPTNPNFNPYVPVDFVTDLLAADLATHHNTGANATHNAAVADRDRPAMGRDHPYHAKDLVAQPVVAANTPPHTFFNSNSPILNTRTGNTNGLAWLTHLDRQAVNVLEVLHVQPDTPALVLQNFDPNTGLQGIGYLWFRTGVKSTHLLDLLTTGTRLPGSPIGGREAGKINLNAINDARALQALLDPQTGNNFAALPTFVTDLWTNITSGPAARNPNPSPRATIYEGGMDRPFHNSLNVQPIVDESTLRVIPAMIKMNDRPIFLNNFEQSTDRSSYTQLEPLRKIWNNVSNTSDSFLVMMTVGFFEVENNGPWSVTNQPVLGKELQDKVPGDLRTQFAGIVDRSCLGLADATVGAAPANAVPFQTKLVTDAVVGASTVDIEALFVPAGSPLPTGVNATVDTAVIFNDGDNRFLMIDSNATAAGNFRLRVGYGDALTNNCDGEWLTISPITATVPNPIRRKTVATATGTAPVPGQVTLALHELTMGPTRFHGGGTLVSNIVFGNPGPQPGVTLKQLQQRGIVPYFTRIEP